MKILLVVMMILNIAFSIYGMSRSDTHSSAIGWSSAIAGWMSSLLLVIFYL